MAGNLKEKKLIKLGYYKINKRIKIVSQRIPGILDSMVEYRKKELH